MAVLDVSMPRMTGIQAAREIGAHSPETRVVLLSMHDDDRYFLEGLKAGASRLRAQARRRLRPDRGRAHGGLRAAASSRPRASGSSPASGPRAATRPATRLTPRELEVVKLIAEAHTNKQIAETLQLSEKTVESHRSNVFAKLGMRDRVELVRYAIRRGLIEA